MNWYIEVNDTEMSELSIEYFDVQDIKPRRQWVIHDVPL